MSALVVYAGRSAAAPSSPVLPGGLVMTWTGHDGSVWDLTNTAVNGLVLSPGVRGLGMPEAQRYTSESPSLDGARFRGSRVTSREVFWPLHVLHDSGPQWVNRDAAFWATMRPDKTGTWAVRAPFGQTRRLRCRWVATEDEFVLDPTNAGWAGYGVYLVADEDPYWAGDALVRSFSQGTPVDFFDPGGSPPFHISAGNLLATAHVNNPGDVDAYPVWRIDGPATTVTVGVSGRVVEVPIALVEGESVTVDTHPSQQTATREDGADVTAQLGAVDFAAIPPGTIVPLSLSMTGTGTVTATLTPRWYRAW